MKPHTPDILHKGLWGRFCPYKQSCKSQRVPAVTGDLHLSSRAVLCSICYIIL